MAKASEICEKNYQSYLKKFEGEEGTEFLVTHYGEFSQELVNSITNGIEESLLEAGVKKGLIKRIFSILVEGLQNIRLHGEKDENNHQSSFVLVTSGEESFSIVMGNLIKASAWSGIKERIVEVNEKDPKEVKQLYMDVLTNGVISSKGGAGLGFITMAMKSKNTLGYTEEDADGDLKCFAVEVKLDRPNQNK